MTPKQLKAMREKTGLCPLGMARFIQNEIKSPKLPVSARSIFYFEAGEKTKGSIYNFYIYFLKIAIDRLNGVHNTKGRKGDENENNI